MGATTRFSERFDQALILAFLAHDHAYRKGIRIPYIMHPLQVAALTERYGFSEDVAIAGLLHDVLEDADFESATLQEALRETFDEFRALAESADDFRTGTETFIAEHFGTAVLDLVLAVTELKMEGSEKRDWRTRKEEQLAHIPHMSRNGAALKAADALHNVRSVIRDVRGSGRDGLDRFTATLDQALWHYGALAEALRGHMSKHPLALELDDAVFELTELLDRLLSTDTVARRCLFCGSDHQVGTPCVQRESSTFVVKNAAGKRIRSLAHWRRVAPPAGRDRQWATGRSALEVARAWSGLTVPREVIDALRHDHQCRAD
jgi:hypothetical protein